MNIMVYFRSIKILNTSLKRKVQNLDSEYTPRDQYISSHSKPASQKKSAATAKVKSVLGRFRSESPSRSKEVSPSSSLGQDVEERQKLQSSSLRNLPIHPRIRRHYEEMGKKTEDLNAHGFPRNPAIPTSADRRFKMPATPMDFSENGIEHGTNSSSNGTFEDSGATPLTPQKCSALYEPKASSKSGQPSYRYDPSSPKCIKLQKQLEQEFETMKKEPSLKQYEINSRIPGLLRDAKWTKVAERLRHPLISPGLDGDENVSPLDYVLNYLKETYKDPSDELFTISKFMIEKALFKEGKIKVSAFRDYVEDNEPVKNLLHRQLGSAISSPNKDVPIVNLIFEHADTEDSSKAILARDMYGLTPYHYLVNRHNVTNPHDIIKTIERMEKISGIDLREAVKEKNLRVYDPVLRDYMKERRLDDLLLF